MGQSPPHRSPLEAAYSAALDYLQGLAGRRVGAEADAASMRAALGGPLPEQGEAPGRVVEELARRADPGIVASSGPRFFGFVIGGSLPAAVGADWLTSAWDQNAGLFVLSPAAAIVEDTVLQWLIELFGLPRGTGAGFVTGGQMANTTCLAVARHSVLARAGWDVAAKGLHGAPPVAVILGDEAHVTVYGALRLLGLGDAWANRVACDAEGRIIPDALQAALRDAKGRPTIVCAQAGNVNTGSFDPFARIVPLLREHDNTWLHVDAAFGLWAGASPRYQHHLAGVEGADSWATDAHKWLNVPYDSGLALVRDRSAHRAAMARTAAYLQPSSTERDNYEWTAEFSRRARGFSVYAALRSLGRSGVVELVDRCCEHARLFAELLAAAPGVRVVNEVVLNQVLVRFERPGDTAEEGDAWTREVIARIQKEGICWLSGTVWHGSALMRISVCNWSTTTEDVRRSAAAILAAHQRG
jgi:glutamate/tyrosine decarboxylase-like PLP-dependent enzyme